MEIIPPNQSKPKTLAERIISHAQGPLFLLWVFASLAYGLAIIVIGSMGIADSFGSLWGWLALMVAIIFRITFPLVIGSFLAAINIWHWHWLFALLFASPGIIFIIPGLFVALISVIIKKDK